LAELAGVDTPVMDRVILWAQQHMGVELLVQVDGSSDYKLKGKDVAATTNAPQRFCISSMDDLRSLYPKEVVVEETHQTAAR